MGSAGGHDPGQVLVDLAVMLADGDEAIRDIAVLAVGSCISGGRGRLRH